MAGHAIWTAANLVTALRIALVWPAGYLIMAGDTPRNYVALVIFLVAALSDGLDGYLARSRNEITKLGQLLDPVADKLLGIVVFGALILHDALPAWAFWVLVAKEVLLVVGGVVLMGAGRKVSAARFLGKLATVALFAGIAAVLLGWAGLGEALVIAGVGISVAAGIDYALTAFRQTAS